MDPHPPADEPLPIDERPEEPAPPAPAADPAAESSAPPSPTAHAEEESAAFGHSPVCLNCGAELAGRFCATCGQRRVLGRLRFGHIVSAGWKEFINVDRGFLHTFLMLCRDPGQVALDYSEGRRARHCPPFRYFLIWLALLVVTPPLIGLDMKEVLRETMESSMEGLGGVGAVMGEKGMRWQLALLEHQRLMTVAAIPFYAAGTWLIFLDRKRTFAEHCVFMLYVQAQTMIVSILLQVLLRFGVGTWVQQLVGLFLLCYMVWALQKFVRQAWWVCVLKVFAVWALVSIVMCLLAFIVAMGIYLAG